jgi:D-tyrosyl-tRNA(Tyr) deacylase
MASSDIAITKDDLHDWVEDETRALDVVASWETLCDVYRTLEFHDPLSDAMRMEEYKWIIGEMNKHLSRARRKLLGCTDPESMKEVLTGMFTPTEAKVSNRMDLTYHKLRQMWVSRMIARLETMTMREEEEHGRTGFWDD